MRRTSRGSGRPRTCARRHLRTACPWAPELRPLGAPHCSAGASAGAPPSQRFRRPFPSRPSAARPRWQRSRRACRRSAWAVRTLRPRCEPCGRAPTPRPCASTRTTSGARTEAARLSPAKPRLSPRRATVRRLPLGQYTERKGLLTCQARRFWLLPSPNHVMRNPSQCSVQCCSAVLQGSPRHSIHSFGASLEMAEDGCQRWHAESGGVANNAVALAVQSALPLVENSEQAAHLTTPSLALSPLSSPTSRQERDCGCACGD